MTAHLQAEQARLSELYGYRILDTPAEKDFDDIAVLAAHLCRTPVALVSFVDDNRQWFKARVGVDIREFPRDSSFCAVAMYGESVMEIPDARLDARFANNPKVVGEPGVRFYAGAPLKSPSGQPIGGLCVVDYEPRVLTTAQGQGLRTLARHVMVELELRRYLRGLDEANRRLRYAEQVKDEFLARVNHELRTPLSSIHGYLETMADDELPPAVTARFMATVRRNSDRLMHVVDDMLLAAQLSSAPPVLDRERTDLTELASRAAATNRPLANAKGLTLLTEADGPVLADVDPTRLAQAIDRLVLNAIKFTGSGTITIGTGTRAGRAVLTVADTGVGMPENDRERLFNAFRRARSAEQAEIQGMGLGLTIVKAIIDSHGATIDIADNVTAGQGTTVTIGLAPA
jgi:signal transduction histidine kinase